MRDFILPLALAIAALAMAPAAAFGEGESPSNPSSVEVMPEDSATHCSAVTLTNHVASGTCEIHAHSNGTVDLLGHTIFGETVAARCLHEFTGAVNETGAGEIGMSQIAFAYEPGQSIDCPPETDGIHHCDEQTADAHGHSANWPFQLYEDTDGQKWADVTMCIEETIVGTLAGDLWIKVNDAAGDDHVTSFSANDDPSPTGGHAIRNLEAGNLGPELWGSWNVEGDTVEITH